MKKEAAPPPVKKVAAPEDLQQIARHWKQIVGATGHALHAVLSKTGPRYDSQTGDARLYLEVSDSVGRDILLQPGQLEELQKAIQDVTKKELQYTIEVVAPKQRSGLENIPTEEILKQQIAATIESK